MNVKARIKQLELKTTRVKGTQERCRIVLHELAEYQIRIETGVDWASDEQNPTTHATMLVHLPVQSTLPGENELS